VKLSHFHAFEPLCPRCLVGGGGEVPLVIGTVVRAVTHGGEEDIEEGILFCGACRMEFPILDGIPIVLNDLRTFVRDNLSHLLTRTDVSPVLESVLADASGPGTVFEAARQFISSYASDHYGDLAPDLERPLIGPAAPGAVARHIAAGFELFGDAPAPQAALALDLGCSVGRSSFELTRQIRGLVLGLDLNIPMLRLGRRILTSGRVNYRERRVGLVYDNRDFVAALPSPERVDFWAANVLEAPFRAARMGHVAAMNVIDCVPSPATFLHEIERLLAPGAGAIVSTPYDWSAAATPYEAWIGGHSQRGPMAGAAEPLIRSLIGGDHAHAARGLELVGEREIEWHVRMHSRSTVLYQCHLMAVRRKA